MSVDRYRLTFAWTPCDTPIEDGVMLRDCAKAIVTSRLATSFPALHFAQRRCAENILTFDLTLEVFVEHPDTPDSLAALVIKMLTNSAVGMSSTTCHTNTQMLKGLS